MRARSSEMEAESRGGVLPYATRSREQSPDRASAFHRRHLSRARGLPAARDAVSRFRATAHRDYAHSHTSARKFMRASPTVLPPNRLSAGINPRVEPVESFGVRSGNRDYRRSRNGKCPGRRGRCRSTGNGYRRENRDGR